MGSTFQKMPGKYNQTSMFGTEKPIPVWLQFVPGLVQDVVINRNSMSYQDDRDINSIIAVSHVTDKKNLKVKATAKRRYYPLFRGMTDVPIKGDQVLLCTFGGVDYYMGPVNTVNSPNFNIDHLNLQSSNELGQMIKQKSGNKGLNKAGISSTFKAIPKMMRLQKPYNKELDDSFGHVPDDIEFLDTHGDMIFEGRHGNSLRIGSRDLNPYIIFSNGRIPGKTTESLYSDGTTMLFSQNGTIHQHFKNDLIIEEEGTDPVIKYFNLSSDTIGETKEGGQKRLIGAKDTEDPESVGLYDYTYSTSQFLLNSDKITFNSQRDSMFLSAFKDVVLGSGNTLNLISENETVIESSNIYLGRQARKKKNDGEVAEPVVLGEQLRLFLEEFIGIMEQAHGLCQGAPIPIMDSTGSPLLAKLQKLKNKISSVETAPFNSEYHFIEDNGTKP